MSQWFQKNNLVYWIFCLFFIQGVHASSALSKLTSPTLPQVLTAEEAFSVGVTYEGSVVNVMWQIAPQCYLYKESVKINLVSANNEEISLINEANLPAGEKVHDPYFGDQVIYNSNINVPVDLAQFIQSKALHSLTLQIDYQGCAKSGFCYPPITNSFVVNIENNHIKNILPLSEAALEKSAPAKAEPPTEEKTPPKSKSFLTTVVGFYFAGLLLAFTPCVLPMIPILFVVIVGQGHLGTRRAFLVSLTYVLSMAVTYAFAGIMVATIGKNLQASLQKPLVLILFSALFVYLGLVQLGIGKVSLPAKWRDWLHNSHSKQASGSYIGAIIMGVLATLIASPCVSAPMIAALSYISKSGNIVLGGSSLFAMGLGMGTLLLVIGTLEGKFLPKKGPWMHAVNQTFSIILFGLSIWFMNTLLPGSIMLVLWGLLLLLASIWMGTFSIHPNRSGRIGALLAVYALLLFWGSWHGADNPLKPLSTNPWVVSTSGMPSLQARFESIDSLAGLAAQQDIAMKRGRPLMVVFHAHWCTSCKHFEHDVLASDEIQNRLLNWETVMADVTQNNEANQLLLKKFDLVGPPVVLFFDKNGNELTKYRLIGDTSRKKFSALLTEIEKEMQG